MASTRHPLELPCCTELEGLRGLHECDVVSLEQDSSCNTVVCQDLMTLFASHCLRRHIPFK